MTLAFPSRWPVQRVMRKDPGDSEKRIPLAYFITFRSYGTWLHGRAGSVDRFHNRYGTSRLPANAKRHAYNKSLMKRPPVSLTTARRRAILAAVKETCEIRNWKLWVSNIRTNHVHAVVSAPCDPEPVLIALKANATRKMRETGCWQSGRTPWALRGSKRYLWDDKDLCDAIDYVLYDQGEPLPE